jgi:hypothetical protein
MRNNGRHGTRGDCPPGRQGRSSTARSSHRLRPQGPNPRSLAPGPKKGRPDYPLGPGPADSARGNTLKMEDLRLHVPRHPFRPCRVSPGLPQKSVEGYGLRWGPAFLRDGEDQGKRRGGKLASDGIPFYAWSKSATATDRKTRKTRSLRLRFLALPLVVK